MRATVLYRIASVLLILFAAGHTFGFLSFKPPSAEGRAVYDDMNEVHFQVKGATWSYGGFYRGFGLFVTAYLLFSAFLAWYLGALAGTDARVIGALGWVFFSPSSGIAGSELDIFFSRTGNVFRTRGGLSRLVRVVGRRNIGTVLVRSALAPKP